MDTLYLIDNLNLYSTYGISVKTAKGLLDLADHKEVLQNEWPDEHGIEVSLSAKQYRKGNDIELECILAGTTKADFYAKIMAFYAAMESKVIHLLKAPELSRVYPVMLKGNVPFERLIWWDAAKNYGKFTLKFVCAYPVSRQFTANQSTLAQVTLNATTTKQLDIFWGEGTYTKTTGGAKTKNYSATGIYTVVLAGDISAISALSLTGLVEITGI